MTSDPRLQLPDVSFYQDDPATPKGVDFRVMRRRTPACIMRAGQRTWPDRDFKKNWQAAKEAGLLRGAYWFYDSRSAPEAQAELFAELLNHDFGDLPLWGDFEDTYLGPYGGWRNWYNFLARLQKLTDGHEIGIYTGYYYWKEWTLGAGIPISSLNWFSQFSLWIANYGAMFPLVPLPWKEWTLWQYTDNGDGTLYGVESLNIDLNYYNGSVEEFIDRWGGSAHVPDARWKLALDFSDGSRLNFKETQ